jgi:hypothetical protein
MSTYPSSTYRRREPSSRTSRSCRLAIVLRSSERGLSVETYWDTSLGKSERKPPVSWRDYKGRLRHRLEEAVEKEMVSDVPIGVMLSGGIDSSTVLAMMFFPKGTSEKLAAKIPLFHYSQWIARRGFDFFHHIAFDQLVSPQTSYIPRSTIDEWLHHPRIDSRATYVIFRNATSWKFGGRTRP